MDRNRQVGAAPARDARAFIQGNVIVPGARRFGAKAARFIGPAVQFCRDLERHVFPVSPVADGTRMFAAVPRADQTVHVGARRSGNEHAVVKENVLVPGARQFGAKAALLFYPAFQFFRDLKRHMFLVSPLADGALSDFEDTPAQKLIFDYVLGHSK